ncbi:MAG: hypothetical protein WA485_10370 [Candidatus Sulfotelmatobacter sp.]
MAERRYAEDARERELSVDVVISSVYRGLGCAHIVYIRTKKERDVFELKLLP